MIVLGKWTASTAMAVEHCSMPNASFSVNATSPFADVHSPSRSHAPNHEESGNQIQETQENQLKAEQGVPVYRRQGAPQTEP